MNNGNYSALRSSHGKYLCAEQNGTLVANRDAVGAWEQFAVPLGKTGFGIFNPAHGRYVCAEQNGQAVANRQQQDIWESFSVQNA